MEQYFFKVGHTYTDKNKLYAELREWIELQHGTLITGKDGLKAFKKMLKDKVDQLCAKHNRCKPITIQYLEHYNKKPDSSVFVSGSWTAEYYKVRIELPAREIQLSVRSAAVSNFETLTIKMRKAQKEYFAYKGKDMSLKGKILQKSIALEVKVDDYLTTVFNPKLDL